MPSDPTLYLYTSLTAGSSHIITATSRIETILKANKIPFKAVDIATDDKARMLWTRRSKSRKIPGLVKFNDVIADLDQVEEWNEYGELEDQIEDQIDIFGDVPISATSAEAHAAAAARVQAQEEAKRAAQESTGRTASESRHISISDPKDQQKKEKDNSAASAEKKDSPLSMAMRQAGAEAAAKAGEKKASALTAVAAAAASASASASASTSASTSAAATTKAITSAPKDTEEILPPPLAHSSASISKLDADAEELTEENTSAKTPDQLEKDGQLKSTAEKPSTSSADEDSSNKSTPAQIIDQRRQSSIPNNPSSLSKSISVDESHAIRTAQDKSKSAHSVAAPSSKQSGPKLESAETKNAKQTEKEAAIKDDDEDEDENDDDEDDEDDEDDDDDHNVKVDKPQAANKIAVGATDKEEDKVLKGAKPQEQGAKDGSKAGLSIGD